MFAKIADQTKKATFNFTNYLHKSLGQSKLGFRAQTWSLVSFTGVTHWKLKIDFLPAIVSQDGYQWNHPCRQSKFENRSHARNSRSRPSPVKSPSPAEKCRCLWIENLISLEILNISCTILFWRSHTSLNTSEYCSWYFKLSITGDWLQAK